MAVRVQPGDRRKVALYTSNPIACAIASFQQLRLAPLVSATIIITVAAIAVMFMSMFMIMLNDHGNGCRARTRAAVGIGHGQGDRRFTEAIGSRRRLSQRELVAVRIV